MSKKLMTLDDGCNPELVEKAFFDGKLEIPIVPAPKEIIIPSKLVPYSKIDYVDDPNAFVCFYENDALFGDIFRNIDKVIPKLKRFAGVISPDFSINYDMPLSYQVINIARNRAFAYKTYSEGLYTVVNTRWGDRRTYTKDIFPEEIAFLGAPHNSIVSIGSYGCIKDKEKRQNFVEGLGAMVDELSPQIVLTYGSFPNYIFDNLKSKTKFINYPDWTSYKKGVDKNGYR